jgi:hypothetical protein
MMKGLLGGERILYDVWSLLGCSAVNHIEFDRRFRGLYCLYHQGDEYALMMEAVRTSEMSVIFNKITITRRYIPEVSKFHTRCRENVKCHRERILFTIQC